MVLIWASLFFPLLTLSGSNFPLPARSDHILFLRADPKLVGPENLCIVFGGVVGTYSGGGNPTTDVYTWLVKDPRGNEIFNRSGGSQFETIKLSFNEVGEFSIALNIRRNNTIILNESMSVNVQKGPELAILPDYLICGDSPTEISAIDPATPNLTQYTFEWTDVEGNFLANTNTISVTKEGFYKFELYLNGSSGQECLITGSTYAGPSLDFNLEIDAETVCQGGEVQAKVDTPIVGEWFLVKPSSSEKVSLGSAYSIRLAPESIGDPGLYTLVFSASDPNFPDCKSERKLNFEILESPKFNVIDVEKPDNCTSQNGGFSVNSISDLDSLFILESGFSFGALAPNQTISLSSLAPQIYTIRAYANGCEFSTLFNLETKSPPIIDSTTPAIILPAYSVSEETCGPAGILPGSIQVIFNQGEVDGSYRILSPGIGQVQLGDFQKQDTLKLPLAGGRYLLELKVEGCTYPVSEFTIPKKPQVEFSNPRQLQICDYFDFKPETTQNLVFTLKAPDQSIQTLASGEAFRISQAGEYELLGEPADPSSGLCPKLETFTATLSRNFDFELQLYEQDCFGNQVYKAVISGISADQTSIRWLNGQGEIVGRNELLFSTAPGDYSLTVQPLESGFCPLNPINFTIQPPIFQVEVLLETSKICPDPGFTQIKLSTDSSAVDSIAWIYFDDLGTRRDLAEYTNLEEIRVESPGNYEAVVYNRIGCEIGRNFIAVEVSTALTLPTLEDTYGVCSKGKKGPLINPGDFQEYFWYLGEELVSAVPEFSPKEVGEYTLRVVTVDGCEFYDSFSTYDACSFDYIFPNAMVLGDPARNFEVRVSEGITSVELFILNRQGSLIHYDRSDEIPFGEEFLEWDGQVSGVSIPTGTYVVVLVGRNPQYQFEQKITGSLLVLD